MYNVFCLTSTNYNWKAYGKMFSLVSYETFFVKLAKPHQVRPRELRDTLTCEGCGRVVHLSEDALKCSRVPGTPCSVWKVGAWPPSPVVSAGFTNGCDKAVTNPHGYFLQDSTWRWCGWALPSFSPPSNTFTMCITFLLLEYYCILFFKGTASFCICCVAVLYFVYSWLRRNYFSMPSICYYVLKLNDFSLFSPPRYFLSKCFILLVSFSKLKKLIHADSKRLKQNRKLCNENVKERTWGLK